MNQLRPYQTEALISINNLLEKGINKQLVVMATGLGKTRLAAELIHQFNKVLWLTHVEELINQSSLAILNNIFHDNSHMLSIINKITSSEGGIIGLHKMDLFSQSGIENIKNTVGIIKREQFDIDSKIVVASVQTLHRRLDIIDANYFDLIICDEAHCFGANIFRKILDHFHPKLRLGLTATPYRMDGFGLGYLFDEIAYEYNIADGIKDGYLCEIEAISIKTNVNIDNVRTTAGELNSKDLKIIDTPERNLLIVNKYKEYASGRQAIVYCSDVEHVLNITESFKEAGINVDFVVGDVSLCPNRSERINNFKSGQTQVMVNCEILVAGFDYPDVGCIIMACPTKSKTKFVQAVGRGTRLKTPEFVQQFGQNLILLDVFDITSKHKLVNSASLDYGLPIEDRVFMTKKKKEELIKNRKTVNFDGDLFNNDKRKKLFEIPKVEYKWQPWMNKDCTIKQLEFLRALGYDVENNTYTMGMASKLIGGTEATEKQKNALRKWGYNVPDTLTRIEADAAFMDIEKRTGITLNSRKGNAFVKKQ